MIPVIICGGFGTKLWPVSRQYKPKHFLPIIGDKSLFQINYESLLTKFKPSEIYVSTNEDQVELAKKQAPDIPQENYILEPEMRNQGPATCLIASILYKKGFKDEPFMIIQADDIREPVEDFIKMIDACDEIARKDTRYLTGGMRLNEVVMGVDYLRKGERINQEGGVGIYSVSEFIWRSTEEETKKLVDSGDVLIHTNHTCMTPNNFLEMMKKYKKEWYEPMMAIINGADISQEFSKMPTGPLEDVTQQVHKAGESVVVELPFKWYDFGTFESLYNYLHEKGLYEPEENIIEYDSRGNFVKLDDHNKAVALVGVENLVVIDTGDALLVCSKDATSKVGEALKEVKNRKLALT